LAQEQVDQAVAAARNANAQHDAAVAQIATARAQIKVLDAQIATARLNLSYAHIVSPVVGHIAQRSVAPGNYVSPGQELMAIVPDRLWVTANFKETQLRLMRRGQPVRVRMDSCDRDVGGHIDSIQPGAGQAFGILPPENATGNYVKVVQRVPVKILLDQVPQGCALGPGMSVEPRVKVR
jgi:membrane fusion protein (multidrug efflux system)